MLLRILWSTRESVDHARGWRGEGAITCNSKSKKTAPPGVCALLFPTGRRTTPLFGRYIILLWYCSGRQTTL